jgi:hypothetical protein
MWVRAMIPAMLDKFAPLFSLGDLEIAVLYPDMVRVLWLG